MVSPPLYVFCGRLVAACPAIGEGDASAVLTVVRILHRCVCVLQQSAIQRYGARHIGKGKGQTHDCVVWTCATSFLLFSRKYAPFCIVSDFGSPFLGR